MVTAQDLDCHLVLLLSILYNKSRLSEKFFMLLWLA